MHAMAEERMNMDRSKAIEAALKILKRDLGRDQLCVWESARSRISGNFHHVVELDIAVGVGGVHADA